MEKQQAFKWEAQTIEANHVIAACDYHHAEQHLMPAKFRRDDNAATGKNARCRPAPCLFY